MTYMDLLRTSANKTGSIVSMGMDPVLERIPLEGETEEVIFKFYKEILEAIKSEDSYPGAVKPNIAFFEQYGMDGLRALKRLIEVYKAEKIPLIIDAKRGDIGKTSAAYARNLFDYWGADAITVAPYMGFDSVKPFLEKGFAYVLCRTSNKGASDFQDLETGGKKLYMRVADKILEWKAGAVVGATYQEELAVLAKKMKGTPLLIPGVGAQGGSASETTSILKQEGYDLSLARINSTSGINYAYEKTGGEDYAGAAAKHLKSLNKEISFSEKQ